MASHALGYGPEDPVALVESCYRAVEWLLATHTAKGLLIPRHWKPIRRRRSEPIRPAEGQAGRWPAFSAAPVGWVRPAVVVMAAAHANRGTPKCR